MDISKLRELEGQELSYAAICKQVEEDVKSGRSKVAQMKEWGKYCDLEKIKGTHRYLIKEVYDADMTAMIEQLDAPEQQLLFEAALYQAFQAAGYKPLYLSNTEALKLFQEVNDNFTYSFSPRGLTRINRNFVYMSDVSKVVYKILHQWTQRRIDAMADRKVVMKRRGFRAYYKMEFDGIEYTMFRNIQPDSEAEKRCQRVFVKALSELHGVKYVAYAPVGWMPEAKWMEFENLLEKYTKEEFAKEGYINIRNVTILSPMLSEDVDAMLQAVKEEIGSVGVINSEAKRKIMNTTQLDQICTNSQRREFIDYNMEAKPPMWFDGREEKE